MSLSKTLLRLEVSVKKQRFLGVKLFLDIFYVHKGSSEKKERRPGQREMLFDKKRLDSRIPIGAKIDRSRSRMAEEGHSELLVGNTGTHAKRCCCQFMRTCEILHCFIIKERRIVV